MPNVGPVGRLGFNVGVAGFRVHTVSLLLVSGGALLFVGLGTPADIGFAFQRNDGLRAGVVRGGPLCLWFSFCLRAYSCKPKPAPVLRISSNVACCVSDGTSARPGYIAGQMPCPMPRKTFILFSFLKCLSKRHLGRSYNNPPLPPNFVLDAMHPLQRDKRRDRRVC